MIVDKMHLLIQKPEIILIEKTKEGWVLTLKSRDSESYVDECHLTNEDLILLCQAGVNLMVVGGRDRS